VPFLAEKDFKSPEFKFKVWRPAAINRLGVQNAIEQSRTRGSRMEAKNFVLSPEAPGGRFLAFGRLNLSSGSRLTLGPELIASLASCLIVGHASGGQMISMEAGSRRKSDLRGGRPRAKRPIINGLRRPDIQGGGQCVCPPVAFLKPVLLISKL